MIQNSIPAEIENFFFELSKKKFILFVGIELRIIPQLIVFILCNNLNFFKYIHSATVNCYRVEFPPCVQWLTLEFDPQCGTAQLEDYLLISIPLRGNSDENLVQFKEAGTKDENAKRQLSRAGNCKNAKIFLSCCDKKKSDFSNSLDDHTLDWVVVKKFNT